MNTNLNIDEMREVYRRLRALRRAAPYGYSLLQHIWIMSQKGFSELSSLLDGIGCSLYTPAYCDDYSLLLGLPIYFWNKEDQVEKIIKKWGHCESKKYRYDPQGLRKINYDIFKDIGYMGIAYLGDISTIEYHADIEVVRRNQNETK